MPYSDRYEKAFLSLMRVEQGLANLKGDRGGLTIYGIAKNFWPQYWKDGQPTLETARTFYHTEFWTPLRCESLESAVVSFELFEAAVNCGHLAGVRFLQKACNLIGDGLVPPVVEDGKIGPLTIRTTNMLTRNYEPAIVAAQNFYQASYYIGLGNHNFTRGWFNKRLIVPKEYL